MEEKSYVGMLNCWICGKGAEILLDMRLRNTLKQNMGSRPDIVCSDCEKQSKENDAIWLISIKDGDEPALDGKMWNPYRTGAMILIKKEALRRFFRESLNEEAIESHIRMVDKNTYFYLPDQVWDIYGLPRGEAQ